ncbi:cation-translocating P-type ATPase [uncultured Selenomonas sp.]|uniref:heavy metal translocating P-type ATPase n=1 Tax=uncultured Selenomonas sp. TaxID=159275 RepID=UPI0028DCEB8F|nr:cation-translocating P-type ATPase [uncultured Selenomonas sp.]
MDMLKKMLQGSDTLRDGILLALSAAALLASFAGAEPFGFDMAWVAVLFSGAPIVCGAFLALVREHDIRADLLVSLALIASLAIGEIFAAGEIAFIMQLGAFLEEYTVGRARAGIERLVALAPQMAWRVREGKAEEVRADEVAVGDRLRVLAGEKIPADGRIVTGRTAVDEAVLTGESMPVDKNPGDEVKSGTLNQFGTFEMIAEKVGEDMALTRLIRLVQEADAGKAKIVRLADRWATWIVVFALAASLLAQYITGDVLRAVTVLVVFCPCALVLATPTAVMAAIGNAARRGFLVKEGDALERLSSVTAVAFDKTGTLTNGTPRVQTITPLADGWSDGRVLAAAAALESHSEHPLGKAIVACHAEKSAAAGIGRERSDMDELLAAASPTVDILPGEGIVARSKGAVCLAAGNVRLLRRLGIRLAERAEEASLRCLDEGAAIVYLVEGDAVVGLIALADAVRTGAKRMVRRLQEEGLRPVLLTGDNERAAAAVTQSLAIEEVHAHLLPEDKLAAIEELAKDGSPTAMIGDGINDAPALKRAFVGIAMGRSGDGIAAEAADIAITQGSVEELSHLFALSRHLMKTIRRNIAFSLALNFLAIALAVTGEIGPVLGALIHNTGSILVIISSALLLHWKSGKDEAPLPSPSPVQEEKGLAKRSFFATMKENCAATDARVLKECSTKDKSLGASFWSFLAKHSWG